MTTVQSQIAKMPIRKELRRYYTGPIWRAIRARILERAGNKCERCGAPNRVILARNGGWWFDAANRIARDERGCERCPAGNFLPNRFVHIVLTIAHLNHDPSDNRDENLAALCQWCHLSHDIRFHVTNRRRTLAAKTGQGWLSEEIANGVLP